MQKQTIVDANRIINSAGSYVYTLEAENERLRARNAVMRAALQDIASSEEIPTSSKAYEFCRDVARAALED